MTERNYRFLSVQKQVIDCQDCGRTAKAIWCDQIIVYAELVLLPNNVVTLTSFSPFLQDGILWSWGYEQLYSPDIW